MSDFDAADIAVFVCIELAIFAFGMGLAVMFPEATALVWFHCCPTRNTNEEDLKSSVML